MSRASVYATYKDTALKLAAKDGGVSRDELKSTLGVSIFIINKVIEQSGLVSQGKVGHKEFFRAATSTVQSSQPVVVEEVKLPTGATAAVIVNTPPVTPPAAPPPKVEKKEEAVVVIPSKPVASTNGATNGNGTKPRDDTDHQINEARKKVEADTIELAKVFSRLSEHQALLAALLLLKVNSIPTKS